MGSRPTVLLGVTGGIAVYKSAQLLRDMQRSGMDVRVIMTPWAARFVAPLTFQTLSQHPVHLDNEGAIRSDSAITHIAEGNQADIMVVAPATANTLSKFANGIADNLLTSTYLAYDGTVVVAPAMNTNMWKHPATQRSIARLREDGVYVVEPGRGELACGVFGSGRMAEPDTILADVKLRLQVDRKTDLVGWKVLITAGGTREPVDAVRYMGNRSSGKMGFALARAANARGAHVEVVKANVDLPAVPGARHVDACTADDMYREVMGRLPGIDILIMAAAVADYRLAECVLPGKVSKRREDWSVCFEPTVDILKEVAKVRENQFVVGFAAEYGPEDILRARHKLESKNLDMIVFNDISRSDIGFSSDYNEVTILTPDDESKVERAPKETVAEIILDHIAQAVRARRAAAQYF
jgi:phosphopantothenoylcysteine decarboxylase/phosphopantothenate--cysteine ligase